MGDMGFSGGFETMSKGEDTEHWLDTVSAPPIVSLGSFLITLF